MLRPMLGVLATVAFSLSGDVQIEGWRVNMGPGVIQSAHWEPAKRELTRQLQDIKRIVGDAALSKLQKVKIWVNVASDVTPCMAYHPGAGWLKEHQQNPAMAKGVELANCKNFTSWTYEQPWMVLHELAHAYHDQFLDKGFENPDILGVFASTVQSKKYESVLHWDGNSIKHYALNNQMEFFAESTESYFGTNDFYPFVRAELKTFDPQTFSLMKRIWGDPVKR